jgi:hypothetical protein
LPSLDAKGLVEASGSYDFTATPREGVAIDLRFDLHVTPIMPLCSGSGVVE